ncbi:MAG: hypothetical protein BWY72_00934 [Bacteroidetes bacterium ADurb.Bin416]|nr:MAG: hypothetical protein BWY72_00934 [Bacteroidetes bacterium ADurb.Bin416]
MTTTDGFGNNNQIVVFQRSQGIGISSRKALDVDGFAIFLTQNGIQENGVVVNTRIGGIGAVIQIGHFKGSVRVETAGSAHQVVAGIDHEFDSVGGYRTDGITGDGNQHVVRFFIFVLYFVNSMCISTGNLRNDISLLNQTSGSNTVESLHLVVRGVGAIKNLHHIVGDHQILENLMGFKTGINRDGSGLGTRICRCSPTPTAAGIIVGFHTQNGYPSY